MNCSIFQSEDTFVSDSVKLSDQMDKFKLERRYPFYNNTVKLPSFIKNGSQIQIYFQEEMVNQVFRGLYDANLLKYHLKEIRSEDIVNDVFLRLFLINDIDTNLISIFVPEIYN